MKRLVSQCLLLGLVLGLISSCTDPQAGGGKPDDSTAATAPGTATTPTGMGTDTAATPTGTASGSAGGTATPTTPGEAGATQRPGGLPGGARAIAEETDDFVFDYAYPAAAGSLPELAALLDRRLERARASIARQSAEARAQARENGFPYNKYSSGMEWKVVAELPDWLSLSGEANSYTGGAHGMSGMQSLLWNKSTRRAMKGIDLFVSPQALEDAVSRRYCAALDRQRAQRRPEPIEGDAYGFNACPPIKDLTVLVGSSNGRVFDRLTLYAGPYVAGPYVEGAYATNLDVDAEVVEAVKPEYREAFGARN